MDKSAAGRKGGDRRAAKYTHEELQQFAFKNSTHEQRVAWGKLGGRRTLPTMKDIGRDAGETRRKIISAKPIAAMNRAALRKLYRNKNTLAD